MNNRNVDEQREIIQRNYEKKLRDDRDLENKRNQLSLSSMQDQKERMRHEFANKLRDARR